MQVKERLQYAGTCTYISECSNLGVNAQQQATGNVSKCPPGRGGETCDVLLPRARPEAVHYYWLCVMARI
jgi:hypothetical protein